MNRGLLYEYEEILLGNKKQFSNAFFDSDMVTNKKNAVDVLRFAFEIFLKWRPEEAFRYVTKDIVDKMRLDLLYPYLDIPCEINMNRDFFYLGHLAYPNRNKLDKNALTLKVYRDLLDGVAKKFPKGYLDGADGVERACMCFQYMVKQYLYFKSIDEMYAFFASPKAIPTLRNYKLYVIENTLFDSPIDFLHESLPESQKDPFLFHYHKFQYLNRKLRKQVKELEKKNAK